MIELFTSMVHMTRSYHIESHFHSVPKILRRDNGELNSPYGTPPPWRQTTGNVVTLG